MVGTQLKICHTFVTRTNKMKASKRAVNTMTLSNSAEALTCCKVIWTFHQISCSVLYCNKKCHTFETRINKNCCAYWHSHHVLGSWYVEHYTAESTVGIQMLLAPARTQFKWSNPVDENCVIFAIVLSHFGFTIDDKILLNPHQAHQSSYVNIIIYSNARWSHSLLLSHCVYTQWIHRRILEAYAREKKNSKTKKPIHKPDQFEVWRAKKKTFILFTYVLGVEQRFASCALTNLRRMIFGFFWNAQFKHTSRYV